MKKMNLDDRGMYVAYGSNLHVRQMAMRCPTAELCFCGEVEGYELVFRGASRGSFATIEPCEGKSVPVAVWRLQKDDWMRLDFYEGYPRLYDIRRVPVKYGESEISASAYIMSDGHKYGLPSPSYFETLLVGYGDHGLDIQQLYDALTATSERMSEQTNGLTWNGGDFTYSVG